MCHNAGLNDSNSNIPPQVRGQVQAAEMEAQGREHRGRGLHEAADADYSCDSADEHDGLKKSERTRHRVPRVARLLP